MLRAKTHAKCLYIYFIVRKLCKFHKSEQKEQSNLEQ